MGYFNIDFNQFKPSNSLKSQPEPFAVIQIDPLEEATDSKNTMQAKRAWKYLMSQDILSPKIILKTHEILMLHADIPTKQKGHWRKVNAVMEGKFITPIMIWQRIPLAIDQWIRKSMREYPEVNAKALHIQFEIIHPFVDGNGRVGRMLMNWIQIKRNEKPLLSLYKNNKREYYKWFELEPGISI